MSSNLQLYAELVKKMFFIFLFVLFASFSSEYFSTPGTQPELEHYKDYYDSVADKTLTMAEYERLKANEEKYLEAINSDENIASVAAHIILVKLIFVPCTSLLLLVWGLRFGFSEKKYLFCSMVAIFLISIGNVNFLEAGLYSASFALGNFHFIKKTKPSSSTNLLA